MPESSIVRGQMLCAPPCTPLLANTVPTAEHTSPAMPDNIPMAEGKRCPKCNSRRIRRSHRELQERIEYPDRKFYRCRKCRTRFARPCEPEPAESDASDAERSEEDIALASEDEARELQRRLYRRFVLMFVLACILTGLAVWILGQP